ncbi:MAG TPA: M56 family metallopeptidase [Terracidiphilus sp.]|nr:M56 family metallopeptidase [Terracidiphilus sp.]
MMHAAISLLLGAALRALAAAGVLALGLRLLRVKNVPAQKAAWGVVLMTAIAMPLLMRVPWLPAWAQVKLPVPQWISGLDATRVDANTPNSPALRVSSNAAINTASVDVSRFSAPAISKMPFDAPPSTATADASADASDDAPTDASVNAAETMPVEAPVAAAASALKTDHPASKASSRSGIGLFGIGLLAYLGIAVILLFRLLVGLGSSLRVWKRAKPVNIAPDFNIPVRTSRSVASPVNIASGILLPADYAQWDEEKLRVVLAHERSHVVQRDFYLQLVAGLYAALTWFSPLGWWLKSKLSELGEAISDRAGLEAAGSPSAYAELLLEFAALPRPALSGVAMAHSSRLSQRIERLLNDESFRQAFAGKKRALLAVAAAPVALMAATALVHVQAAEIAVQPPEKLELTAQSPTAATPGRSTPGVLAARPSGAASNPSQASSPSSDAMCLEGQSHPEQSQVTDEEGQSDPAPVADPQPTPAPQAVPAPPAPPVQVQGAIPPIDVEVHVPPMPPMPSMAAVTAQINESLHDLRYEFRYDWGDPYAVVGDPGTKTHYFGDWDDEERNAEIEKARKVAHGHFLWFRHDGKSYIVDDPAIVSQVEAMQKPMEDLSAQMKEMSRQMREANQQAREEARKAREASQNITPPDLTQEMADLNAAVAALKNAQGGTITREQLREIERKVQELQRKLINAQIKVDVKWSDMGEFGKAQGEYGEKMGKLGAQMGQMAHENSGKIQSIIDESLKNGKARPVE